MRAKRVIVLGLGVLLVAALLVARRSDAADVGTVGSVNAKGLLAGIDSVSPYLVAARAVYCFDVLGADTGLWGTRKAEPQDEEKKKAWREIQYEAQYWSSLHGRLSLFGMHFKLRGKSVVAETARASCDADLEMIRGEPGRTMLATWKSGWETANRRNRGERTVVDGGADRTEELIGWCAVALDSSIDKLRRRPAAFGYDENSAADLALIGLIAARLERARLKWRDLERESADPWQKLSVSAGRSVAVQTGAALRKRAGTAQTVDIVLRHWLATEADLCVRVMLTDENEVTMPPLAGGPTWVPAPPRLRSTTPYAFAWIAELCRAAEVRRNKGTANAVAQAWLPIHDTTARWAMRHGQSLRQLDIDVHNTEFTPAHEAACAKDLQQLNTDFTARVQKWDAEEETARKTPFTPALGRTALVNAFENGWCAEMHYSFARTLEHAPEKLSFDASTADGRVKIEQIRKSRLSNGGDWVSRFIGMQPADGVSGDALREQFNAGMASFRRYAELVKDDRVAFPWLFVNETRSCAILE